MKPLIYIAAPYSTGDQVANAREAMRVGQLLWDTGLVVPFIPHLNVAWHLAFPHPVEYWYAYDLAFMPHCHALLRLHGESSGRPDAEVEAAVELGLRVFSADQIDHLFRWAERWEAA